MTTPLMTTPLMTSLVMTSLVMTTLFLTACGSTVKMEGTADEVWNDTIDVLRLQGAMPDEIPPGLERPRVDRAKGEIDLPYAESVYYGEGAAFVQVDIDEPAESRERTVRMWVDYPVGMKVVRYGRAINDETTAVFRASFEQHLARLRAGHDAPASESAASSENTSQ
ncbi:MAG: hypothetical protein ACKO3W_03610 [bacterium]